MRIGHRADAALVTQQTQFVREIVRRVGPIVGRLRKAPPYDSVELKRGSTVASGAGSRSRMAAIKTTALVASNARFPVTISYTIAPSAQRSVRASVG